MTLFDIHFQAEPSSDQAENLTSAQVGALVANALTAEALRPTVSQVHKTGDQGAPEVIYRPDGDPVPVKEALAAWGKRHQTQDVDEIRKRLVKVLPLLHNSALTQVFSIVEFIDGDGE